jgi:hypothetical protein
LILGVYLQHLDLEFSGSNLCRDAGLRYNHCAVLLTGTLYASVNALSVAQYRYS